MLYFAYHCWSEHRLVRIKKFLLCSALKHSRPKWFRGKKIHTDWDIRVEQCEFKDLTVSASSDEGTSAGIISYKSGNRTVKWVKWGLRQIACNLWTFKFAQTRLSSHSPRSTRCRGGLQVGSPGLPIWSSSEHKLTPVYLQFSGSLHGLTQNTVILISIPGQAMGLCTSAGIAEKAGKRKLPSDWTMLLSKPQGYCE